MKDGSDRGTFIGNDGPLRLVSTAVIANRLGVSRRTVRHWADSGLMPAVKIGRQWRVAEPEFQRWLLEQRMKVSY